MGMKIFMGICMLPVLLIMYAVALGVEKSKGGMLYGVTLWSGALEQEEVKELQKSYKKWLKYSMLLTLALFLLAFMTNHFSIFITLEIIWVFLAISIPFVPYVKANNRLLALKREYHVLSGVEEPKEAGQTAYVDMAAAAAEKPIFFKKSTIGAVAFAFLPAFVEFIRVKINLWNILGAPELWISELLLLSLASVTLICLLLLFYCRRTATKVYCNNSQVNIQIARMKQYQWSWFASVMAWSSAVYSWLMLVSLYRDGEGMLYVMLSSTLLYMLVTMWAVWKCFKKMHQNVEKYLSREGCQIEDDDRNWIWGMFYYNKNDNRFWVETRLGTGFTSNMGKKSARIVSILVMIATVVFLVVMCGWMIMEDFTPVGLAYENESLVSSHWKEEYTIPCSEIESIELWQEQPRMSKRNGTGMETVRKGDFFSREYERSFELCLNPQAGPYLMVKTTDGTWYLLGDKTGAETSKIFEQITKDMEHK